MRKNLKRFVPAILVFAIALGFAMPALAGTPDLGGELANVGAGFGASEQDTDLPTVIGRIIKVVLAFLGIILLIVVLYGGFLWMTAGGSEEKVDKAKSWIINGIIGLVIILLSYAIASYVVDKLTTEIITG